MNLQGQPAGGERMWAETVSGKLRPDKKEQQFGYPPSDDSTRGRKATDGGLAISLKVLED